MSKRLFNILLEVFLCDRICEVRDDDSKPVAFIENCFFLLGLLYCKYSTHKVGLVEFLYSLLAFFLVLKLDVSEAFDLPLLVTDEPDFLDCRAWNLFGNEVSQVRLSGSVWEILNECGLCFILTFCGWLGNVNENFLTFDLVFV